MIKTYVSNTGLSFNVKKADAKKKTHVNFDSLTINGSIFTTDDERLQEAIEAHRFFKEGTITIAKEEDEKAPDTDNVTESDTTEGEAQEDKKEVVEFASVVEGKDYLADAYGVSRTQLRTRAAIESYAAEKGLTVVWKS